MEKPVLAAEDFSFYLKEKKGAFVWLGTAKQDQDPVWPLHNSRFDVDESALLLGVCAELSFALR